MKRIFTLLQSVIVITTLLSVNVCAQTWTIYDGSVLPTAATPAWTAGDVGSPAAQYSVVDDGDNKVLYETTAASAEKQSFKLNITQPASATVMIRFKAGNNPVSSEFEVNTTYNTLKSRGYIRLVNHAKGGYITTNYLATNSSYPADSNLNIKTFHTYRITVENGVDFKLYLDENPNPIITGTENTGSTQNQFLRFGDVGNNFTEGYIDWIAWDVTGVYGPGTTLPAGVIVDQPTKANSLAVNRFKLNENPVKETLIINNASEITGYEIYGINGRLISKGKNIKNNLMVGVNNYKPGVYVIKLMTKGKTEQIKFLKQ